MTGWTEEHVPHLTEGTVAVVTGANTGLGLDTTRVLARRGATVMMACRNQDKAAAARRSLVDGGIDPGRLRTASLDLADQASIAGFADALPDDRIDLLINNAGLMAVPRSSTVDGFETQFGVNHLGHMALTLRLLPRLNTTPGARVVTLTSMGHRPGRIRLHDPNFRRGRYNRWTAYFQSKLANMLFAAELARRNEGRGRCPSPPTPATPSPNSARTPASRRVCSRSPTGSPPSPRPPGHGPRCAPRPTRPRSTAPCTAPVAWSRAVPSARRRAARHAGPTSPAVSGTSRSTCCRPRRSPTRWRDPGVPVLRVDRRAAAARCAFTTCTTRFASKGATATGTWAGETPKCLAGAGG